MLAILKEEMEKCFKSYKNTHWKEQNKTVKDLKVEIGSIKITQNEGNLQMRNVGPETGASEVSLTTEYRRSKRDSQALKTQQKKWIPSLKKMLNLKHTQHKEHPGNLRHSEKNKSKSNWN